MSHTYWNQAAVYSLLAYAPFGETYVQAGAVDTSFTGAGSGLCFLFRRHSSTQGRRLSPDPAGLAAVNPANPQAWNRYAYVSNNPLALVDPLGLVPPCTNDPNDGKICAVQSITVTPGTMPGCVASGTEGCIPFPCSVLGNGGGPPSPVTIGGSPSGGGSGNSGSSVGAANNQNVAKSAKDECSAGYYNSTAGKLIDFGTVLGLVPAWSPNASQNFTEIATLGRPKYGGLSATATAANKWNVVTIQSLNTTTTIGSSAAGGFAYGGANFGAPASVAVAKWYQWDSLAGSSKLCGGEGLTGVVHDESIRFLQAVHRKLGLAAKEVRLDIGSRRIQVGRSLQGNSHECPPNSYAQHSAHPQTGANASGLRREPLHNAKA